MPYATPLNTTLLVAMGQILKYLLNEVPHSEHVEIDKIINTGTALMDLSVYGSARDNNITTYRQNVADSVDSLYAVFGLSKPPAATGGSTPNRYLYAVLIALVSIIVFLVIQFKGTYLYNGQEGETQRWPA